MDKLNVSLRYGLTHRSFDSEASSSAMEQPVRNLDSEVDFDDVFGGPPTRTRYSFGSGRIKSLEESTGSSSGLGERPVFGESYSSPRKKTSDDFYDDIFRRSDESVRSPRWSNATPGSRNLSPSNGKSEPFGGSVPAEFSLPAKSTKTVDIPVFGSNVYTLNTSRSRFSSPSTQGRGVLSNNSGQSPGQTFLSRESSSVKESLNSPRSTEDENKSKNRTTRTGSGSPSSDFHFSIHKWANVGVPLLMSLRGPSLKGSSKVSAVSIENSQDTGFPNDDLSAQKEDVKPVSGISLAEVIEKETTTVKPVVNEEEVILPSSLLHDETERQGYEEAGREAERKENMETTSSKKKTDAKKNTSKKVEANKPAIGSPKSRVKGMVKDFFKISNQESPPKAKTNVVSGGLSSRWKTSSKSRTQEEVVISKPDLVSRLPSVDVQKMQDASNTANLHEDNVKMAPDASSTKPLDSKVPAENVNVVGSASSAIPLDSQVPTDNVYSVPDASFKVTENVMKPNKPKFPHNRTIRKLEDINFQKDASPASGPVPNDSKANAENIDDPSLDNFQVEELALVEDKDSNTQEESEAFKAIDSKIHMWSSGRKGNIRSLLSTLQLVLWAGSGWKPVALVDIIEANAVKKSYNRAMLCLHPDKLQQKGADAEKKYTAEKVFDILQSKPEVSRVADTLFQPNRTCYFSQFLQEFETGGQSPGQTFLSRESSSVKESLNSPRSTEDENKSKNRTTRTGSGSPSSDFHFSIHKWANVGVPLLMSLRGPSLKGSSKVSAVSIENSQDTGFPNDDLSAQKEDVKPVSGISLAEVIEKETTTVKPVVNEEEVILPSSLLHDETERQGYEEAGREAERKENMETTSSKKKTDAKKNTSKKVEANKPAIGSPKSRVKGMVKDFFKISNQESPPKAKTNVVSGGLSSRWKTSSKSRTQEEVVISKPNLVSRLPSVDVQKMQDASNTANLHEDNVKMAPDASNTKPLDSKVPAENVNVVGSASSARPLDSQVPTDNVYTVPDASFKVTENVMKPNKPKFPQNRTIRKLEDINFQKDASPASGPVPNDSKANAESMDDPSLDNFQVEELALVEDKDSKTQEESEAFKVRTYFSFHQILYGSSVCLSRQRY
ncbi:DnaJ domain-containing protein [Artemisia annua]|uniref:DnaJ domain-containing protein n=1 Tax=Artemisia annua TaxID=35608 RepID=A0A2U1Q467_ARTAN|nr:DnaJ domain-containing protein [Artemisia annua]